MDIVSPSFEMWVAALAQQLSAYSSDLAQRPRSNSGGLKSYDLLKLSTGWSHPAASPVLDPPLLALSRTRVVVAVIRANKNDLPAIVRALMRMGPRYDDSGKTPPSLPKP